MFFTSLKMLQNKFFFVRSLKKYYLVLIHSFLYPPIQVYSQTCVQRPPLGPEKCGHYAEG